MYHIFSPYLKPLLQTRSQKNAINTIAGNKEKDPTKKLVPRATTTFTKRYLKLISFYVIF